MNEEDVTKNILDWLEMNNWTIVCYDFPQSGTGVLLHMNNEKRTSKNKGSIIPDIIAVNDGVALFFENKDQFYEPDFKKLYEIKIGNNYSDSLENLLNEYKVKSIYYGIGIPNVDKDIKKSKVHIDKIDFLISTNKTKSISIQYDIYNIFKTEY